MDTSSLDHLVKSFLIPGKIIYDRGVRDAAKKAEGVDLDSGDKSLYFGAVTSELGKLAIYSYLAYELVKYIR